MATTREDNAQTGHQCMEGQGQQGQSYQFVFFYLDPILLIKLVNINADDAQMIVLNLIVGFFQELSTFRSFCKMVLLFVCSTDCVF